MNCGKVFKSIVERYSINCYLLNDQKIIEILKTSGEHEFAYRLISPEGPYCLNVHFVSFGKTLAIGSSISLGSLSI